MVTITPKPSVPMLSPDEWAALHATLGSRLEDQTARAAAEVGLLRLQKRYSTSGIRTFGWTEVPASLGITGKNAHKRLNAWFKSGKWWIFWDALMLLRAGAARPAAPNTTTASSPIEALLAELHRAYSFFNLRFTAGCMPQDISITLERPQRPMSRMRGYHSLHPMPTPEGTRPHIALIPERLGNVAEMLQVLLHEMAHLRNSQLGFQDTDTRTQYHTLDFKVSAELFGLTCSDRDRTRGYAHTELGPRAKHAIEQLQPVHNLYQFGVRSA